MTDTIKRIGTKDVAGLLDTTFTMVRQHNAGQIVKRTLQADWLRTPIGPILLAGDDERLHLLSFITEETAMIRKMAITTKKLESSIELGVAAAPARAKRELTEYFAGERQAFETPLALVGTAFQIKVWEALREVPFGQTVTYAELAQKIGSPSAFRAVAQANSQNPISIIIPCHRVINASGDIGGYAGGIDRKVELLEFEQKALANSR